MTEERKPAPRKKREVDEAGPEREAGERPSCFVMMPISDPEGYATGHFLRVYEDVFKPAILQAGYHPVRADDDTASNLIHLSFLRQLRDAPIAICDLSTRNGNVLYELGFRQAFDMPTVLVMEEGTPSLFDVASLRTYSYRRARLYNEVLEDQARIRDAILTTVEAAARSEGVHSLVRLLELERPASRAEVQKAESDPALQIVRAELAEMRLEMRRLATPDNPTAVLGDTTQSVSTFYVLLDSSEPGLAEDQLASAIFNSMPESRLHLRRHGASGLIVVKTERPASFARFVAIVERESQQKDIKVAEIGRGLVPRAPES